MKKLIMLALLLSCTLVTFATKYTLSGQTDREDNEFKITNLKLENLEPKSEYSFFSTVANLKTGDNILAKNKALKIIGASGKTIDLVRIFTSQKRRALSMGDKETTLVTNYDADVICQLINKENLYEIHILTGEDAREFLKAKQKK
jgi:hypothetical protein